MTTPSTNLSILGFPWNWTAPPVSLPYPLPEGGVVVTIEAPEHPARSEQRAHGIAGHER